jgi:hypothetical protein
MALDFTAISTRSQASSAVPFRPRRVILGGYTARSAEVRDRHIEELRTLGIKPPDRVPAFWPVSDWLLTTDDRIQVQGDRTSGEVEFALVFHGGRTLVTVASDQTDREFEATSIPRSKQLCPKVVARQLLPFDELADRWDEIVLSSEVTDGAGGWRPYQRASLGSIMAPRELVAACLGSAAVEDGTVLLSGTIPLLDGETRYADGFRASMTVPGWDGALTFSYRVEALSERADPVPVG